MSDLRGRTLYDLVAGLNAGQHLGVDAVVAFVDGELGPGAYDRAAEHLTGCPACASEVAGQRQASSVVRAAGTPRIPAGLLAALREIPHTVQLPTSPDGLAVAGDGTVVGVADPGRSPIAPLGTAAPLGTGPRWGTGPSVLGRRIGRTGAGAMVSGLVLGALIMAFLEDPVTDAAEPQPDGPAPASAVPFVIPVTLPLVEPSGGVPGHASSPVTTQAGWHGAHVTR